MLQRRSSLKTTIGKQKQARLALEEMLDLLGPYLPKSIFEEDDPGRDWEAADRIHTDPDTSKHRSRPEP
jgi:hypothetical protein